MEDRLFSDLRVWHRDSGSPVGVGFVLSPKYLMTCAHVVADSLGDHSLASSAEKPTSEIDFPALASPISRETKVAIVKTWRPRGGASPDDVAILELRGDAPSAVRQIWMCPSYEVGDRLVAFGLRSGLPNGALVEGRVLGLLTGSRLEITGDSDDTALRRGCSGGAAWNVSRGGVIGMVVEGLQQRSGLLIPMDSLNELYFSETGNRLRTAPNLIPQSDALGLSFDADSDDAVRLKITGQLSLGPPVDRSTIVLPLIRAFAASTDPVRAPAIVGEAGDLVIRALPAIPRNRYAYVIALSELPDPKLSMVDYWAKVFDHACSLGPRMVGALFLVAPPAVLNGSRQAIRELFEKLETIK